MGFVRDITGSNAASASKDAGRIQADASIRASEIQAGLTREAMAQQQAASRESIGLINQKDTESLFWNAIGGTGERNTINEASDRGLQDQINYTNQASNQLTDSLSQAQGYLDPLNSVAQRGVEASNYLANPQAQYDGLVNNPLYQAALDNANRQSSSMAAAGGRINTGDTLEQLSNNVLLSASPLIDRQRQDSQFLLGQANDLYNTRSNLAMNNGLNQANLSSSLGNNLSTINLNRGSALANQRMNEGNEVTSALRANGMNQANLLTGNAAQQSALLGQQGTALANGLTGAANASAAGRVGAANARSQAYGNIMNAAATAAAASDFELKSNVTPAAPTGRLYDSNWLSSDEVLKENVAISEKGRGYNWYTWDWNELAGEKLGLFGSSEGVIAQEVQQTNPEAVVTKDGFLHVNYGAL